jgi:hypothetical protein
MDDIMRPSSPRDIGSVTYFPPEVVLAEVCHCPGGMLKQVIVDHRPKGVQNGAPN